ncbi:aconitate hydratase AcnA [Candidatus Amarolinea aalborgensis]|jgi:aconitate hydratase|uniref:aconitate hydratase AcnA n=1 Tax=Candidatus Amarolinea aalborgensis TaxID=2249329 RepID=UPI003BF9AA6C
MADFTHNHYNARTALETATGRVYYYRLAALEEAGLAAISRLPFSIKILLETALRNWDEFLVTEKDIINLATWNPQAPAQVEIPFMTGRVVMQDFTGVPAVVDLAALRAAMARLGGDAERINPLIPADLVIDHSVQVDSFATSNALLFNAEREFERNRERYEFLRWGQQSFSNFRVVPPATGIVHQVNLEYLASVVRTETTTQGDIVAFPDTLVGTDSHTTMINGLGVLGWGVGGIEAEAAMLGQPMYMLMPEVIGVKITGRLPQGATATDLALRVTQLLRAKGVVGKFVEFYGDGVGRMSLADRATIANMAPEYGATMGFFPVDAETLRYLRGTGRSAELADLVERYCRAQGLFRTDGMPEPQFTDTLTLDMATIEPSLAGPKRPQDRVALADVKQSFAAALTAPIAQRGFALSPASTGAAAAVSYEHETLELHHGSVVIAAITSCTNTSNPSVMIGAGLVAKKAVERGLRVAPYVKTSLAPGSRVVTDYLAEAGLTPYLEALGFHTVGYGCTTCIGNSGPVPDVVADAIKEENLVAAAVLSGNRNFEGRINPSVRANYLASPPLVVAFALAGTMDVDLATEPVGTDRNGNPVYLHEIWPSQEEVQATVSRALKPEMYAQQYGNVFGANEAWNAIKIPEGKLYDWDPSSTYIQEPTFFETLSPEPAAMGNILGARVLALVGDSVTTDHISPAGNIAKNSPAGRYLMSLGVQPVDFNSYGARRGNHEVMMRGTFANIRLKNLMLNGVEGGYTLYLPTGEQMSIYDAAMQYKASGTPLVILTGKEYGTGSSRDWAAKGTMLLGVKAVIAESFERIHRSNLVGMGVLPLQFLPGESAQTLGLNGQEIFDITGMDDAMQAGQIMHVRATRLDGTTTQFQSLSRIDTPVEVEYYRHGGILQFVLRKMLKG